MSGGGIPGGGGIQSWPGAAPGPSTSGGGAALRFGVPALVVAALVGISFALALVTGANTRDYGSLIGIAADDSGGSDSGGGSDYDSGGDDGSSGYSTASPTPTQSDPTLDAYKSVSTGDCLATWMISDYEWVTEVPEVVSCSADNAGVSVSRTTDSLSTCPSDAGQSYIYYTSSSTAETVVLCVTRKFEAGQCFFGYTNGSANLLSWADCDGTLPSSYTQMFNVTSVFDAPASPTGDECLRSSTDSNTYYWWTIDDDSTMLCAVAYH